MVHPLMRRLSPPKSVPIQVLAARKAAMDAFRPLWMDALALPCFAKLYRSNSRRSCRERTRVARTARRRAYRWLAAQLGIPESKCQISLFNRAMCARAVAVCYGVSAAEVRAWALRRKDPVDE